MRIPPRHRMARDRLPVRAAAWLMAILLWTSAGGHLLVESGAGVFGSGSELGAAAVAGAGSMEGDGSVVPSTIPAASSTALLGPACDAEGSSKLGDKLPPLDCVLCEGLETPATSLAPPAVALPLPSAVEGDGGPDRWVCGHPLRQPQARAPPRA
jgi:hypothetical protein